jgi:hypothetical protein
VDDIDKIESLLKQHGAKLERTKKHKVWRFPDGRIWVVAGSPRSSQSFRNNYHDLCRFLGVEEERRKNPERKRKQGIERRERLAAITTLPDKLREGLASIRTRFAPPFVPAPCSSAMWLERIEVSPLRVIPRRLLA